MTVPQSNVQPRSLLDHNLPLFVYSYSSRGFPDVIERMRHSFSYVPSYLISLYDYVYVIPQDLIKVDDERIRIWDSGGYETRQDEDYSAVYPAPSGSKTWSKADYVDSAKRIPWNGYDILASYDSHSQGVALHQQIKQALELFDKVNGEYFRDLVVHLSDGSDPAPLMDTLRLYVDEFHILGLIEKEIAPSWVHGAWFIHQVRTALSALSPNRYIPIHIFGCFDPKTVIRFVMAGADIFDGLTWMRYLFLDRSTLYKREVEYTVGVGQLVSAGNVELSIMIHNIEEMEHLRSDIIYAISVGDMSDFELEKADVCAALKGCPELGGV